MPQKRVFIAFAKEDEASRNLFTGQRVNSKSPIEFIDMSVKQPYDSAWKTQTRSRIKGSHGVIALLSSSTPGADGQLWEIKCAVEEGKPLLGIWLGDYRTKPAAMGSGPCKPWTWVNVTNFVDNL
ncbi:MAG: TIR domain-containing protein [Candidatus Microthrix subdominans]